MIPLPSLAKNIWDLRNERRLTQEQLGKKVGVERSTIRLYEVGERCPSLPVLIRLSRVFGVSTDYLLGLSSEKDHFMDVSGLTPEQVAAIETVVENFRECNNR